jgi:hypothetical protein
LAVFIVPVSVATFVTSAISDAIRKDIATANELAVKLTAQLKSSTVERATIAAASGGARVRNQPQATLRNDVVPRTVCCGRMIGVQRLVASFLVGLGLRRSVSWPAIVGRGKHLRNIRTVRSNTDQAFRDEGNNGTRRSLACRL